MDYDPLDLLGRAAVVERWDDRDWRHVRKMEAALSETFQVETVAGNHLGLIAYDSEYSSFEAVRFTQGARQPTLEAYAALSRRLLNLKAAAKRTGAL
jgi:hypothetical protein